MHRTQTLCPGTQYMPYIYLRRKIMINTAHHNLYKTRLTDQIHAEVKYDEENTITGGYRTFNHSHKCMLIYELRQAKRDLR